MRYTTIVDPTRPEAVAALMPQMPIAPGSRAVFWGGANVHGAPGTVPVSSPRPSALGMNDWGEHYQSSGNSPDYMLPSQYQSVPSNLWSHVRTASSNEIPVPAGNPKQLAGIAMVSRRMGGNTQVPQPQVVQTWPSSIQGYVGLGNAGWKVGG